MKLVLDLEFHKEKVNVFIDHNLSFSIGFDNWIEDKTSFLFFCELRLIAVIWKDTIQSTLMRSE